MVDSDLARGNSRFFIFGGIGIGVGVFIVCCGLITGIMPIIWFGSIVFLGSFGAIIYAIASGIKFGIGANENQPEERHDGAYIMNKLIVDKKGETVYDVDMHIPEELKYLIQVHFASGRKSEFQTSPVVFDSIGEGQKGTIVIQGRWINQFIFRPEMTGRDDRTYDAPYRPGT